MENVTNDSQTWAYPLLSKAFYDPLSHKIGEFSHSILLEHEYSIKNEIH